jgi:hypothetical protein
MKRMIFAVLLSVSFPLWGIDLRPDYFNVTIPPNIAPLNFEMDDCPPGTKCKVVFTGAEGTRFSFGGNRVKWNRNDWKKFLSANRGKYYTVDISFSTNSVEFASFAATNQVSAVDIDSHLTYRLIPPSYTGFSDMGIYQRDLTSFEEKVLYRNIQVGSAQCVNCHTYNAANPSNYLFHTRAVKGGTVFVSPRYGKFKADLKAEGCISGGVYPAWHPSGDYVVFSQNETRQSFYSANLDKIEVADLQSDLVMYSLADNTVSIIENSPEYFESFPTWTPDGNALFSVCAKTDFNDHSADEVVRGDKISNSATNIFYDLVVRMFDKEKKTFSKPEIVFSGREHKRSITFPRVSPSGRWLVATVGPYGNFHVWHKNTDLVIFDFDKKSIRPIVELNSPDSESYHTFSSKGDWMVFSSRRDDGSFTRPYFTAFDKASGKFSKPFILPVEEPKDHQRRMFSYNIPEFSTGEISESPRRLRKIVESEPRKASIESKTKK